MFKKSCIMFLLSLCVSGCSAMLSGDFLKRSANNKLFDSEGFHKTKRAPVYNKKYIAQAKKNAANPEYIDEEDEDEDENGDHLATAAQENTHMYRIMAEHDSRYKKRTGYKKNYHGAVVVEEEYPQLHNVRNRPDGNYNHENDKLHTELTQLKHMLEETRRELTNTRCPSSSHLESAHSAGSSEPEKALTTDKGVARVKSNSHYEEDEDAPLADNTDHPTRVFSSPQVTKL